MKIKKILVVGAGTMGAGIAQVAAESGFEVTLADQTDAILQKGRLIIEKFINRKKEKNKITREEHEAIISRVHTDSILESAAENADWVIEAIFEDIKIKKEMFNRLDKYCHQNVILASNTSTLSITEIGSATQRPEKVIGMHFFSPVPLMKLVEVIKGEYTTPGTIDEALILSGKLGKTPVVCKDIPGFIVNRFLLLLYNEGASQLENKIASREDIDMALKLGANHPMGILELMDAVGVDVCYYALKAVYEKTKDKRYKPAPLFKKMMEEKSFGKKAGKGFYDYGLSKK